MSEERLPGTERESEKPVTLQEAISEIDRELIVRRHVYEQWIQQKKMTREVARRQYGRLLAARRFLEELRDGKARRA